MVADARDLEAFRASARLNHPTRAARSMSVLPLVTIGLPVYNSKRYVEQSLDSLLGQTYSDFILLISDNASTDGTEDICRRYAAADSRVQYHRNDVNIGNPRNFNRVAALTTTKYLKWSTSDDFWEPTFLERALEIMERDPSIALCYPQAYIVDAAGANREEYNDVLHLMQDDPADRYLALLDRIKLAHQHLGVIRMSCLRRTHMLGTHVGSDVNLLAELTLYGKFFELPERLFSRRFHQDSGSWKRGDLAHDARRYHASNSPRATLKAWRTHARYMAGVRTSPLTVSAKMRLYDMHVRWMFWERRQLFRELRDFVRRPSPA
jgi:glycosyltransferase involved in cell wall biosynthesis